MKLHLEFHHDTAYRISQDATDNWIGILCDENGDEVTCYTNLIEGSGFAYAKATAENFMHETNRWSSGG